MVKPWKDEIKLALVLLGCSAAGGFFGAKMAQSDSPKTPVAHENSEIFGSAPPGPVPHSQPPLIVIVVNDAYPTARQPERAIYKLPEPLNSIQGKVNFI